MRVFLVLRDLYRRLFSGGKGRGAAAAGARAAEGPGGRAALDLSDREAVKVAVKRKLELQHRLKSLRAQVSRVEQMGGGQGGQGGVAAGGKEGAAPAATLSPEEQRLMLEELRKTRQRFNQQTDLIQKHREINKQMLEQGTGLASREEKMKKVYEEIAKLEKDFKL